MQGEGEERVHGPPGRRLDEVVLGSTVRTWVKVGGCAGPPPCSLIAPTP